MPSLSTIDGLGEKAAVAVKKAAKKGKFLSKDDFRQRCKVSKKAIELIKILCYKGAKVSLFIDISRS